MNPGFPPPWNILIAYIRILCVPIRAVSKRLYMMLMQAKCTAIIIRKSH